jgi:O-antigen ligase
MKQSKNTNSKTSTSATLMDKLVMAIWALFPLAYSTRLYDGSYLPRHMYLAYTALPVLALLLFLRKKHFRESWTFPLPILLYLAFWLFHLLATTQAINPTEATFGILKTGSILVWMVVLFQALQSGILSLQSLWRGVTLFSGICAAWAGGQILGTFGSGDFWANIYAVYQPFGHKNLVSGGLMLCLPFLGLAALRDYGVWQKGALVVAAIILIEIFVLRTRAAWLATLVGLLAVMAGLYMHRAEQKILRIKTLAVVAVAGIAVMLMLVSIPSSGEKLTDPGNLQNRFWFWENSVQMMQEYPLGVGPGHWRSYLPKYGLDRADNRVQNGITTINRPHNDYLWVGAELGWAGLLVYLLFFGSGLWGVHKLFGLAAEKDRAAVLLFGLVSLMVFSITDFPLERAEHQFLLAAMMAILCSGAVKIGPELRLPSAAPLVLMGGILLWSAGFMYTRFQSGVAAMEVLKANERKDPMRIVPAVDNTISSAFNVDFYGNPIVYFRGLGNNALKRFDEAEQDFMNALELHPHHIISMNQLGNVYKNQQRYEEALLWFNKAVAIAPEFVQAKLNIAEIQLLTGKLNEAFITLRQTSDYGDNPKKLMLLRELLPRFINDPVMQREQPAKIAAVTRNGTSPEAMIQAFVALRGQGNLSGNP